MALVAQSLPRIGADLQLLRAVVKNGDGQRGGGKMQLFAPVIESDGIVQRPACDRNSFRRFLRSRAFAVNPVAGLAGNGRLVGQLQLALKIRAALGGSAP